MLTDWLIWLDYLEENNYNTSFLRLITPITFGIIETHNYNYTNGSGYGSGYGNGDGDGDGYGHGYGHGYGDGSGYGDGFGCGDGIGIGYGYGYLNYYEEEH